MELTVIIPVHNSEKYLKKCLESVLSQEFQDMEILCIDSGSTDASFRIIDELKKEDHRITYIFDSNSSYGHKVNTGICRARGKYIMILESDDRMCSGTIQKLYEIAQQYNADIIDGDYYEFFIYKNKEYEVLVKKYPDPNLYNHLIHFSSQEKKTLVSSGIWTALYKKTFLMEQDIQLNESKGAAYQDLSFLFLTGLLSNSAYHLSQPVYEYRIDNAGSSMKDDKKIFEVTGECDFLKKDLQRRGIWNEKVQNLYYTRKYEAYRWNYCRLSLNSRALFLERYLKELKQDIERGELCRSQCRERLYANTFLLVDDKRQFIETAIENDKKIPIRQIGYILEKFREQEIAVFGAGALGMVAVCILLQNGNKLKGICDNSGILQGTDRFGIPIMSLEETVRKFPGAFYFIMSRQHGEEMKQQLLREGIKEEFILIFI